MLGGVLTILLGLGCMVTMIGYIIVSEQLDEAESKKDKKANNK